MQPIPVFILGSGRSGTTITSSLLNRFPRIHIAKETGYIGLCVPLLKTMDVRASFESLIKETNAWLESEQWEKRASEEGFREFCTRYDISGPAAWIHYVWQLESPVPWHELEYVGDNTPLYVMAIPALLEFFPNARFIHMMRDPRDIVCSISKMKFGAEDLVAAALEWHTYVGCWLMAERIVSVEHRTEVRYEDLCVEPLATLTRLAEFLGRNQAEAVAALESHTTAGKVEATGFGAVAGLSHHTRLAEPLSPARVGRFRKELTAEQIRSIEEIAQYGMYAWGYQPEKFHQHPLMRGNRLYLLRVMLRDTARRVVRRLRGK
ncbi:MAG: sulfotransferase [Planctomycetaceae bacterium]|nr:sulfotransferase [Planctomycetaceae bacterium]